MVVGDDDLRSIEIPEHVVGYQLPVLEVAVGVVRLEHPEPITNGQSWRHDQEAAGEALAARPPHSVDRLPGDQHSHHRRLAGTGRELERQPREPRIGLLVGGEQMLDEHLPSLAELWSHFRQPDRRLDGLDLTEERPGTLERVVSPMVQEARGFRGDSPATRVWQSAPLVYMTSELVDDRCRIVLLLLGREPLAFVEDELRLLYVAALLRLRDRRDELGAAASLDDLLRRLALVVELPVAGGVLVGRVEDRALEEGVGHGSLESGATELELSRGVK